MADGGKFTGIMKKQFTRANEKVTDAVAIHFILYLSIVLMHLYYTPTDFYTVVRLHLNFNLVFSMFA